MALWPLPRLLIFSKLDKSPAHAGLFSGSNNLCRNLTSNDDDASSGGASDGGDANPSAGDANGGGANPSDGGPSRDRAPNRDGGRGPSVLLPA